LLTFFLYLPLSWLTFILAALLYLLVRQLGSKFRKLATRTSVGAKPEVLLVSSS
jgi:hypothetical protein